LSLFGQNIKSTMIISFYPSFAHISGDGFQINGDVSREVRQGESSRTSQAADKDIDTVEDAVVPHRQTRAASRLAAVSASEDERDDDEDQLLDPRSYLSSKRGWQVRCKL